MTSARALEEKGYRWAGGSGGVYEGRTLGRYELLRPIGSGGMGVVWAARLRGTRGFTRTVAVKVARPLSSDPSFERMFLREAEIASRIKHPNVCPILDLGEEGGVLYLVMEWIDGDTLSTLIDAERARARTVPDGIAAWILAKAARGLQAAHELCDEVGNAVGVVHRDVSPHNILATPDGLVQVVDFGIAKAAVESCSVTRSGYIKGKVAYLAPEQVRGTEVDARADVFSLGIVLFELTTGAHPFRGATDLSTLLHIGAAEPAPVPKREDYPADLAAILATALQKDPAERYASMRRFAADLERYAARVEIGDDVANAFLAEALGDRRDARARVLREAAQATDERARQHLARGVTEKARIDLRGAVEATMQNPREAVARTRSERWRVGLGGLSIVGILVLAGTLGGLSLARVGAHRADEAPAPPSASPAGRIEIPLLPSTAGGVATAESAPSVAVESVPPTPRQHAASVISVDGARSAGPTVHTKPDAGAGPKTLASSRPSADGGPPFRATPGQTASVPTAQEAKLPPTRFRDPGF